MLSSVTEPLNQLWGHPEYERVRDYDDEEDFGTSQIASPRQGYHSVGSAPAYGSVSKWSSETAGFKEEKDQKQMYMKVAGGIFSMGMFFWLVGEAFGSSGTVSTLPEETADLVEDEADVAVVPAVTEDAEEAPEAEVAEETAEVPEEEEAEEVPEEAEAPEAEVAEEVPEAEVAEEADEAPEEEAAEAPEAEEAAEAPEADEALENVDETEADLAEAPAKVQEKVENIMKMAKEEAAKWQQAAGQTETEAETSE